MDIEWARGRVGEYLDILDEHHGMYRAKAEGEAYGSAARLEELHDLIHQKLHTVVQIAARFAPELGNISVQGGGGGIWPYHKRRQLVVVLVGALDDAADVEAHMGPVGPRLGAVELHPWVLEASRSLWDDGYRREAVQGAATALETRLRVKLDRPRGSGKDLCAMFAVDEPTVNSPRLRLPGFDAGTADFISAHDGAKHFGMGVFQAIRNITTHSTEQSDESVALEMLAALSLLARWVDDADVVTAPEAQAGDPEALSDADRAASDMQRG